jgi:hypothetical protein
MRSLHCVEKNGSHRLVECDGRYAVVEERDGRLYGLDPDHRCGYPYSPGGVEEAIGGRWLSRPAAKCLFGEIARIGDRLSKRIW